MKQKNNVNYKHLTKSARLLGGLFFILFSSLSQLSAKSYLQSNRITANQSDSTFIIQSRTDNSPADPCISEVDDYLIPLFHKQLSELAIKIITIEPKTSFRFGFITDTHYIDESYPSLASKNYLHARNIAELSLIQEMDLIVHGGDLSYDYSTKEDLIRGLLKVTKELRKATCPVAVVQGNHDTGDYYGFLNGRDPSLMISPTEWGRLVSIENDGRVYGDFSRSYYYKDFDEKKIRVIILNTHDAWMLDKDGKVKYNRGQNLKEHPIVGAFKSEQLEWLAKEALNFEDKDSEYGVIVISHAGLNDEVLPGRRAPINSDVAEGLIVARKNKTNYASVATTGDFSQNIQIDYSSANDVDIICCINGHSHRDNQIIRNGITFISTTSSRNIKDTKITDDDAWDVFNINTDEKEVMVKRFGSRGVDREFSY